jgi:hypothetical protein
MRAVQLGGPMRPDPARRATPAEPLDELREVVPPRAVLTELARGFLLVQDSNPDRAVRFAATFLRECAAASVGPRVEPTRPVTVGRRRSGPVDTGPVDPSHFPPKR